MLNVCKSYHHQEVDGHTSVTSSILLFKSSNYSFDMCRIDKSSPRLYVRRWVFKNANEDTVRLEAALFVWHLIGFLMWFKLQRPWSLVQFYEPMNQRANEEKNEPCLLLINNVFSLLQPGDGVNLSPCYLSKLWLCRGEHLFVRTLQCDSGSRLIDVHSVCLHVCAHGLLCCEVSCDAAHKGRFQVCSLDSAAQWKQTDSPHKGSMLCISAFIL